MSGRWKIPRKVCPIGKCSEPVRIDRIMCRAHWRPIDRQLKIQNSRVYKTWLLDKRDSEALTALRLTIAMCIISVEDMSGPVIGSDRWKIVKRDGREIVKVKCPNCNQWAALDHTIEPDGTIKPSLQCDEDQCGYHEHAKLEKWDRKEIFTSDPG